MEFEFDKEIDALLRKARGNEVATSVVSHLDADEISAFAENALPENAQQLYTAHLADCTRCRKILSNLISLNAEAETGAASAAIVTESVAKIETPWYRRFFAFPQLAYAMGALVLVFTGFTAYLILQTASNSRDAQISQAPETGSGARGPSFEEPNFSTANTAASNTMSNANVSFNTASNTASVSNAATSVSPVNSAASNATSVNTSSARPSVPAQPLPTLSLREEARDAAKPSETEAERQKNEIQAESATVSDAVKETDAAKRADTAGAALSKLENKPAAKQAAPPPPRAAAPQDLPINGRSADDRSVAKSKKDSFAGKTRTVSGKNFTRRDDVWYDAAYRGQTTTNVLRSSGDYKKLDSGLRSIADSLGGTVVVVWKDKAYRIQ